MGTVEIVAAMIGSGVIGVLVWAWRSQVGDLKRRHDALRKLDLIKVEAAKQMAQDAVDRAKEREKRLEAVIDVYKTRLESLRLQLDVCGDAATRAVVAGRGIDRMLQELSEAANANGAHVVRLPPKK